MKSRLSKHAEVDERRTILIIDDDEDWIEILRTFFTDRYRVQVTNSPVQAMEIVQKQCPDLIIVDLVMPSVDGFGIIQRLSDLNQDCIPKILLTGWKTPEVEECAASVGFDAVLAKPILLPVLDEIVSSMMNDEQVNATGVRAAVAL